MKFSSILAGAALLGSALAEVDPIVIKVRRQLERNGNLQFRELIPILSRALNSSSNQTALNCKIQSTAIYRMFILTLYTSPVSCAVSPINVRSTTYTYYTNNFNLDR